MENSFLQRHNKKIIIGSILAGVVLLLLFNYFNDSNADNNISSTDITVLARSEYVNSVNESGNAVSETNRNIYAERMLPIRSINVEVGDRVEVGDVIATLDDSTILQQIEQKEAMISTSDAASGAQINNAQDMLNQARRNLRDGTNPQIIAAENAVTGAYDAWQSALLNLESISNQSQGSNNPTPNIPNPNNSKDVQNPINSEIQKGLTNLTNDILENTKKINTINEELLKLYNKKQSIAQKLLEVQSQLKNSISDISISTDLSNLLTNLNNYLLDENNNFDLINNEINILKSKISTLSIEDRSKLESILSDLELTLVENKNNSESINKKLEDISNIEEKIREARENIKNLESKNTNIDVDININSGIPQDLPTGIPTDIPSGNPEDSIRVARKTASDLKNQYDAALRNLEVAKIMARDEITALENSLNIAATSGDNTLNYVDIRYLNEELEKTRVTSPIAGTVTDVNMILGQNPQDYLAKIETIETLIIESEVREFDINSIRTGMEVEITSDATGSDEIAKGRITSISPTSKDSSQPMVQQSPTSEVTYDVIINLNEETNDIRPGMNVRVRYILDRKNDVYVVPSSSVYQKGEKFFILVMENENGSEVKEMEVFISSENDFESVITSEDLRDNLIVINSPELYSPGITLKIVDEVIE